MKEKEYGVKGDLERGDGQVSIHVGGGEDLDTCWRWRGFGGARKVDMRLRKNRSVEEGRE